MLLCRYLIVRILLEDLLCESSLNIRAECYFRQWCSMLAAIQNFTTKADMVTDMDRRTCFRQVPMKVLVLGMPRTGSTSLKRALEMLGYSHVYHGEDAFSLNPRDCKMWTAALDAKLNREGRRFSRKEFDQLLGHCQAVSDMPAICFSRELIAAYPEAKVILPVRDFDKWHKSAERFDQYFSSRSSFIFEFFNKVLFMRNRLSLPTFRRSWQALFHGDFASNCRHCFEEHYDTIIRSTPKDRLLLWHVTQGWEPLCEYLDEPVPSTLFPHLSDASSLDAGITSSHCFMVMQYTFRLIHIAAYMSLAWFLWHQFSGEFQTTQSPLKYSALDVVSTLNDWGRNLRNLSNRN